MGCPVAPMVPCAGTVLEVGAVPARRYPPKAGSPHSADRKRITRAMGIFWSGASRARERASRIAARGASR